MMDLLQLVTVQLPAGFFSGYALGMLTMVAADWLQGERTHD